MTYMINFIGIRRSGAWVQHGRLRGTTVVAGLLLLAACGSSTPTSAGSTGTTLAAAGGATTAGGAVTTAAPTEKVTLRLGYFPNVTHATALVGVEKGIFAEALGPNVKLETQTFNAGPAAIEALFGGALDASYIGPSPTINAYAKSKGAALRIISGATSGGASLVVKPDINSAADLKGKKLATPQLGGTQDVALRAWLKDQGLSSDTSGGGDVSIQPQDNGATLDAFKSGAIDGAWVPEPWATRLVLEGNGKTLVDERDIWPGGQFVTTHLIVSTKFLSAHPDVVKRLLDGQAKANDYVNANAADAQKAVNDQIEKITQKRMSDATLAASWKNLSFTNDPAASTLGLVAAKAEAVGLLDSVDLTGIYDLGPLNEVLKAAGKPEVKGP